MLTLGGGCFFIASVILAVNGFVSIAPSTSEMVQAINGAAGKEIVSVTTFGPDPNSMNSNYLQNALPGINF